MRYLGVDYGRRKIGTAFGDDETRMAVAGDILWVESVDDAKKQLITIIQEEGIDVLVFGIPKPMAHHSSDQHDQTKVFAQEVAKLTNIPLHFIDETLTSFESRRIQREKGSDLPEDVLAAMMILEEFLQISH